MSLSLGRAGLEISAEIRETANRFTSRFNPDLRMDNRFIDRAEKIDFAAERNDCSWSQKPGGSLGRPNMETDAGRMAAARLSEFKLDGIRFRDGEPDFGRCSLAKVEIDVTGNYAKDKLRADKALARQWDTEKPKPDGTRWTSREVRAWAYENNLELHHDSDMKTMRYVPAEIHGYYRHMGGVAEIKCRDEVRNGSRFDD